MNYDEQHERVTQDLSESLNQQQKFQERLKKIIAMREAGKTLQEIGDAVGVTRERVRQLLKTTDTVSSRGDFREIRRKAVVTWVENNPLMTLADVGRALGCSQETLRNDLKALGIKRDTHTIQSAAIIKSKLKGRQELTEELLTQEYLTNNLSTNEIARKYGYASNGAVSNRLRKYGMRKDKALVARQISEKRKGKHLIEGRFV